MGSLPGFRFDLMGASGSTGFLSPKSSWRAIILPRGGTIAQDSSGTLLTFDSADVASRFAADVWVQVGLSIANIRKVSAVGGDSISVSGAAVTASENDRCFLIGTTQPSTSGGSATYVIPDTIVRQRDDNGAVIFTNSIITSNSDGLIQGFAETNFYDCIIQDGNRSNQGSVIDLPVGVVEGVSVSTDALFGANVTVNGALGVTGAVTVDGWATFGSTVTMDAQLGVTSHATFGDTVTVHGNFGITGTATFGSTAAFQGNLTGISVSDAAIFGVTVTVHGALGVTQTGTFGQTITATTGNIEATAGDFDGRQFLMGRGTNLIVSGVSLGTNWGTGATHTISSGSNDTRGTILITAGSGSFGANPTVSMSFADGARTTPYFIQTTREEQNTDQITIPFTALPASSTVCQFTFRGTPTSAQTFSFSYLIVG